MFDAVSLVLGLTGVQVGVIGAGGGKGGFEGVDCITIGTIAYSMNVDLIA